MGWGVVGGFVGRAWHRRGMGVELVADCERCAGLCCVALPFATTADFAIDKPAGVACPNLSVDFSCRIHDRLRPEGFPGCIAYDCSGAGQRVTQVVFAGRTWRSDPAIAESMFAAFRVVRPVHELLALLQEAAALAAGSPLLADVEAVVVELERATDASPEDLVRLDVDELRARTAAVLRPVSARARAGASAAAVDLGGADLVGADLRGRDLRGADLRGAILVGADLRQVDLGPASLLGADLRGADLSGADLTEALFLTRSQLVSARGDARTRLPRRLAAPDHW